MTPPPHPATLSATALIDSDNPAIQAFAAQHAQGGGDRERAVSLYLAVRDGFRYDPYRIDLSPNGMRASTVLANGYGWCVPKAALLTAVCRAAGIPARMGFADVVIGEYIGKQMMEVRAMRKDWGIIPTYKMVDTCAAEFEAETPY